MKPSGHRLRSLFLVVGLSMFALTGCDTAKYIPVLSPQGPVARSEYYLIIWSFALMILVVLGVFVIYFYMLVKYRATPENKDYVPPEIEGNTRWETIWTVIPIIIVVALAIPTVAVTYRLVNPPKVLAGTNTSLSTTSSKHLVITAISERWKWVFQYQGQNIETVNYVNIPAGIPVDFELTSTGPMNTFWVPALGGMEFNMPGKDLKLWLEADHPGQTYDGRSAQFSGRGFADMTFKVNTMTTANFNTWVNHIKSTAPALTKQTQSQLNAPGEVPTMQFSTIDPQ